MDDSDDSAFEQIGHAGLPVLVYHNAWLVVGYRRVGYRRGQHHMLGMCGVGSGVWFFLR